MTTYKTRLQFSFWITFLLSICLLATQSGLSSAASSYMPGGIAINQSTGNVYVTEQGYNGQPPKVVEYDLNGHVITQWGQQGSGEGQFQNPMGIAVDSSGSVYVVDWTNHCVEKFYGNGGFITEWGNQGQFEAPIGVATANNRVYVVDRVRGTLQTFDSNGNFLQSVDATVGVNYTPTAVAVDPSSTQGIYVMGAQYNNYPPLPGYVIRFSDQGKRVSSWGPKVQYNFPMIGLDTDWSTGNLYMSITGNAQVVADDGNGKDLFSWGTPGSGNGQFKGPMGLAINQSTQEVYVADSGNFRIQVFDNNGNFLRSWPVS